MQEMAKLRLATASDFNAYYKIKCGYSDIYWNGFDAAPDRVGLYAAFEKRLRNTPDVTGSKVIYMIEADDGTACGYIMFTYNAADVELGFSILEKYQGRGYGTFAVQESLKLLQNQTVFARVRPDNMPSQKCFEKSGFTLAYRETEAKYYPLDGRNYCYNRFELDNRLAKA